MKSLAERKAKVVGCLEAGLDLRTSCQHAGVGKTTVFRWRKSDPVFGSRVAELLEIQQRSRNMMDRSFWGPSVNVHQASEQQQVRYPVPVEVEKDVRELGYTPPRQPTPLDRKPLIVMPPGGTLTPIRTGAEMERRRLDGHAAEVNRAAAERSRCMREFEPLRVGLGDRSTTKNWRRDPLRYRI